MINKNKLSKFQEYHKNYRLTHKKEHREYMKKYREENREQYRKYQREYRRIYTQKQRKKLIILLGSKCVYCGCSDWQCLQIDHVNNDGYKEFNSFKSTYFYYKRILEQILSGSKRYQLLCANCNQIKRYKKKRGTNK